MDDRSPTAATCSPHWTERLPWLVAAALALVVLRGYYLPDGNHTNDIPPIEAALDPGLYPHDFVVSEMKGFTPRFYYAGMIQCLAATGLGIPYSYFLAWCVALAAYVTGAYALGQGISRSPLGGVVTAYWALFGRVFTVGDSAPLLITPIAQSYAMPLAVWGMALCFRQRWVAGYALFGLAGLFQFLVGTLSGLLLLPGLAYWAWTNRQPLRAASALAALGALLALVYVPMKLAGNTSSGLFSAEEFVYVYAVVRHPHHLVPSTWSAASWLIFAAFICAGAVCLSRRGLLTRQAEPLAWGALAACLAALAANYVLIELRPTPLAAKLQFARTTPLLQMILLGVFSAEVVRLSRPGAAWLAAAVFVLLLFNYGPLLLFPLCVLSRTGVFERLLGATHFPSTAEAPGDSTQRWLLAGLLPLAAGLLCFVGGKAGGSIRPLVEDLVTTFGGLGAIVGPLLIVPLPIPRGLRLAAGWACAAIALLFVGLGMTGKLPGPLGRAFAAKIEIWNVPTDDLTQLAVRFRERSPREALVLVPPSFNFFKLYAQRSVVVEFKDYPYTDAGMRQWRECLSAILGRPLTADTKEKLDEQFRARTAGDLVKVAQHYQAGYLLTRADWHPEVPGATVYDRQGDWVLYMLDATGQ